MMQSWFLSWSTLRRAWVIATGVGAVWFAASGVWAAAPGDGQKPVVSPGGEVFAVVGSTAVSFQEYQQALAAGIRQKFYHGRPPHDALAAFQREVGDRVVNRVLLLEEAKRRGIGPDREGVAKSIEGYDKRYAGSAEWRANRERLLPALTAQLEQTSILANFEKRVREVVAPGERETREYYAAHPEQFTEPEQVRLSLILLRVDPSSPKIAWDKAREEAGEIHKRLARGSDFAELARVHSADPSAQKGGDLGYLHRGMLPETIQSEVVDKLAPGQVSVPLGLLEGIAIVRLEDRKAAKRRSYEDVRTRAADLWRREQGDKAWNVLVTELRRRTQIRVDESRYLPLEAGDKDGRPVSGRASPTRAGSTQEDRRVSEATSGK